MVRAKVVLLAADGLGDTEVARRLDCTDETAAPSTAGRKRSTASDEVAQRILGFEAAFRKTATPFDWIFTRQDLNALADRLDRRGQLAPAA